MPLASGSKLELIASNLATSIEAESAITLPVKYKLCHLWFDWPKSYFPLPLWLTKGLIEPLIVIISVLLLIPIIETPLSREDIANVPIVAVPLT